MLCSPKETGNILTPYYSEVMLEISEIDFMPPHSSFVLLWVVDWTPLSTTRKTDLFYTDV
jgi:hypothetical protein